MPIEPITETRADLTLADAYAIQAYNVRRRVEAGRAIRGCRLGRTSQPRQEILGVTEPDFGMLIDDMFVEDGDEDGDIGGCACFPIRHRHARQSSAKSMSCRSGSNSARQLRSSQRCNWSVKAYRVDQRTPEKNPGEGR